MISVKSASYQNVTILKKHFLIKFIHLKLMQYGAHLTLLIGCS